MFCAFRNLHFVQIEQLFLGIPTKCAYLQIVPPIWESQIAQCFLEIPTKHFPQCHTGPPFSMFNYCYLSSNDGFAPAATTQSGVVSNTVT